MTTRETLVALVVRTPAAHAETASTLLFEAGAQGLEERDEAGAIELRTTGAPEVIDPIERSFVELARASGVSIVSVTREAVSDDWRRLWAASLHPVVLTDTLTAVPDDGETQPGQGAIVLERSLAFGFGEHPTTRMAARAVERLCRQLEGARLLDVGTGGGLLAIVADRAGARRARGVDIDPEAVLVARRNAARNGAARCSFDSEPLDGTGTPYDIVVANIDLYTVVVLAGAIAGALTALGVVVLTGFLVDDESDVLGAYRERGLDVTRRQVEEGWLLLELRRR